MCFVSGPTKATVCGEVPLCYVNPWGISDDILSRLSAACCGVRSVSGRFCSGFPLLFRWFSFCSLNDKKTTTRWSGDNVVGFGLA